MDDAKNTPDTQAHDSAREARIIAALEGIRADLMELRSEVLAMRAETTAMRAEAVRAAERSRLHMAAVSQLVADATSPGPVDQ